MYQIDFSKPIHIHFIGIGGISMSGLAEILLQENFKVTGSDMKASEMTALLEEKGAFVNIGQRASNITPDIDLVVYTAAIHKDNEEFQAAVNMKIPMLTRAQLLGQIMNNYHYSVAVSGTHGKTTTTSMLSMILMEADVDPTISVGGMLDAIGGNIRVGHSQYFVTEACEYTNSYHAFHPFVSIILNVDADHLDFFSGIDEIKDSFKTFAGNLPENGLLVINGDMEHTSYITEGQKSRIVTFGLNENNTYRADNITFDESGHGSYTLIKEGKPVIDITLNVCGMHNVTNSLAAIAVADEFGIPFSVCKTGLLSCGGAKRRFEYKGKLGDVTIMDDYAHHPTEIRATLNTAQKTTHNELWVVFQPHTYTRTKALFNEFAEALTLADHVILADIYAAREKDTGLVSSKDLMEKIKSLGTDAIYLKSFDDIENYILLNCKKNDLLITMGAGDIVNIGESLLGK